MLKCSGAGLTAINEVTQCNRRWGCQQKTMGTACQDFQFQLKQKSTEDSNMAHMALCQTATLFSPLEGALFSAAFFTSPVS